MIIRIVKLKKLLFYVITTFVFGLIGAFLGGGTSQIYKSLVKPPFSPPGIVFPIVWSILYLLMGVSAYFLSNERKTEVSNLLKVYWVQLILNALWPLVFWRLETFELAAIIILVMIFFVCWLVIRTLKVNKMSALLLIPYIVWLLFALYLNIGIAVLN